MTVGAYLSSLLIGLCGAICVMMAGVLMYEVTWPDTLVMMAPLMLFAAVTILPLRLYQRRLFQDHPSATLKRGLRAVCWFSGAAVVVGMLAMLTYLEGM